MAGRERIEDVAKRRGWAFSKVADKEFARAWSMLPEIPRQGKLGPLVFADISIANQMREITVFQHIYTTWAGSSPIVVAHSVFSVDVGEAWPDTAIRRRHRGPLGWLSNRRSAKKATPTDDPEFDRRRFVLCRDPEFVRRLMTPALREHILAKDGVMWRIVYGRLCLIYRGKLRGDRMEASVERLTRFLEHAGAGGPVSPDG